MGTIMESPGILQFNSDAIVFISLIFVEIFKFYWNTSNFTILGKILFFTLRLRISSPKLACLYTLMCSTRIRQRNWFNISISKENCFLNFFKKFKKIYICENTAFLIFDFTPWISRGVIHLQYKVCFVLTRIFLID